jgi:hypothetical protein
MIRTIFGRPFIDLSPFLDVEVLASLDEELCCGLTRLPLEYTGGSHKSMGIVPPSMANDVTVDYGQVIARMNRAEFARFVTMSDTPEAFDLDRRDQYEFGEERDWPLSRRQMHYLEYRYGVYFPWKVFYELMPNLRWEDRAQAGGKAFCADARRIFPEAVAFIERLPFVSIGRCTRCSACARTITAPSITTARTSRRSVTSSRSGGDRQLPPPSDPAVHGRARSAVCHLPSGLQRGALAELVLTRLRPRVLQRQPPSVDAHLPAGPESDLAVERFRSRRTWRS